jgi:hypothetical protein
MIVELSSKEVRMCTLPAIERWMEKKSSTDKPNYAKGKADGVLQHELLANIRANICEWAVAKYYNLSWNYPLYPNEIHKDRASLPDVGIDGEVRSVRTRNDIPFWYKDINKRIYGAKVLDTEYFSKVEIYGSIDPNNFMKDQYRDESINGWRVPVDQFS